jgi:hypothetical protein
MNNLAKNSLALQSSTILPVGTLSLFPELDPRENSGVVYTKPWVVDLILTLAGYCPEQNLAARLAVEPAAGEGVFLLAMAQRLAASCRLHGHTLNACQASLLAYELDAGSAQRTRAALKDLLCREGVSLREARSLAKHGCA